MAEGGGCATRPGWTCVSLATGCERDGEGRVDAAGAIMASGKVFSTRWDPLSSALCCVLVVVVYASPSPSYLLFPWPIPHRPSVLATPAT